MPEQVPDLTIREYLDRLAGDAPAPGGGSAAALAGALAAASARMQGSFTVGKKKYAEVEDEIRAHLDAIDEACAEMLALAHEDVVAFGAVGEAYAMPKDSDEEKEARATAIQEALRQAAQVPLDLVAACARLSGHLSPLAEKGNQNLVSDVGVAAKLCQAAAECGWLNVEVNLKFIDNEAFIASKRARLQGMLRECQKACDEAWWRVAGKVTG
ncbi:MAG: cyclodeaminase/cyclohydrolase family protein [Armatimonadota bacterium]